MRIFRQEGARPLCYIVRVIVAADLIQRPCCRAVRRCLPRLVGPPEESDPGQRPLSTAKSGMPWTATAADTGQSGDCCTRRSERLSPRQEPHHTESNGGSQRVDPGAIHKRPATSRLARGGFSIDRAAHVGFAEPIDQVVALTVADPGLDTLLLALGLPSRPGSMCAGRARHRPQAARGFERLKTVSRPPVSFLPGAMQFSMMRAA